MPAIDVGKSVSRVGGKTQLPAYASFIGKLRLFYSQFEEMEMFARFSGRIDEETKKILERGYRIREMLKQEEHDPISMCDQIVITLALLHGLFDSFALEQVADCKKKLRDQFSQLGPSFYQQMLRGEKILPENLQEILKIVRTILGISQ